MTSSDPSTRRLADPPEPARPQWWPDLLLARPQAVEGAPFRPSTWSGHQSAEFQSLRVRVERPAPRAPAAAPVRNASHTSETRVPETAADPAGSTGPGLAQAQTPTSDRLPTAAGTENHADTHPTSTVPATAAVNAGAAGRVATSRTAPVEPPAAQALQDAYARGVEDGQARARARDEAARQRQEALLKHLLDRLDHNAVQTADWSTPMKRLCLRLAEEIVRGELQHPRTVERLVEQGLAALGESSSRPMVRLHPDDLAVLAPMLPRFGERCRFEGVPGMSRGSVEIAADDTLMQDLIENRLRALADQLFQEDADDPSGSAAEA